MAQVGKKKSSALKGKGGLVAAGIAAVLGIWLLADLRKPVREPNSQPPIAEFVGATADEVTRVEMKREKDPFVLVKRNNQWVFESPGRYPASGESVKSWLERLLDKGSVSQETKARPAVNQLGTYGLEKPAAELVLTTSGGTRTLQLGKEFPGASSAGYYAREARDGRLFLLPSSTATTDFRDEKMEDLRDKRLVEIADEKSVKKVTVRRPTDALELERAGEERWRMTQPVQAPADRFDADNLVRDLKSSQAAAFVETNAADLAKYGLDRPRLTVEATDGQGTHVIQFGAPSKQTNVYAAREGSREVLEVPKSVFDNLNKQVADFRDKHLVTLESDKVNSVELTGPGGTIRLRKTGANEWQFLNPPDPKQPRARADKIQTLLTDVTGEASKFIEEAPKDLAKYGLDKPQINVLLSDGRGSGQAVQIGKKSKDGYYARGTTGPVMEVQNFVFDDLNLKPDALKDTSPAK